MRITGYRDPDDRPGLGSAGRRRQRRLRRRGRPGADRPRRRPTRASPASASGRTWRSRPIFAAIEGEDPRGVTALYDRMLRQTFKAGHAGAGLRHHRRARHRAVGHQGPGGRRTAVAAARRPRPARARLRLRPRHRPGRRRTGRGLPGVRRARAAGGQAQGRPRRRARPAPPDPGPRRAHRGRATDGGPA